MLMGDFVKLHKPNHSKEVPAELEQMDEKTQKAEDNQHSREKMLDHKSSNEDKVINLAVSV